MPTARKGWSAEAKLAVAAGSLLAAVVAACLLAGKNGARNRAKLGRWTRRMRQEAMRLIRELDGAGYERLSAQVARRYRALKKADPRELARTVQQIRHTWSHNGHGKRPRPA